MPHRSPRPTPTASSRRRRARWVALAVALVVGTSTCTNSTAADQQWAGSILFVGNSLTYVNDLPQMTRKVAELAGGSLRVGMAAAPDLAVIDHTNGATDAVEQIASGHWDVVVLQQGPTPEGMCRDTLVIAAMRLAPQIRASGGRPALLLPWVRRGFPEAVEWAGESATAAARAVGGIVVPAGIAWRTALAADPTLTLYAADGYHPAPAGTLLAALTVYERVFGRDVHEIPIDRVRAIGGAGLTTAQTTILLDAAHTASAEFPADPPTPAPADTTHVSTTGGPC